jgi:hypothetical protein
MQRRLRHMQRATISFRALACNHTRRNRAAAPDADAAPNSGTTLDTHARPDGNRYAHARPDGIRNADVHANGIRYADARADGIRNADVDANGIHNAGANANGIRNADVHANGSRYADARADGIRNADARADSDADCGLVVRAKRRRGPGCTAWYRREFRGAGWYFGREQRRRDHRLRQSWREPGLFRNRIRVGRRNGRRRWYHPYR